MFSKTELRLEAKILCGEIGTLALKIESFTQMHGLQGDGGSLYAEDIRDSQRKSSVKVEEESAQAWYTDVRVSVAASIFANTLSKVLPVTFLSP